MSLFSDKIRNRHNLSASAAIDSLVDTYKLTDTKASCIEKAPSSYASTMSSHNAYRAPPVDPASAVPFPPPQTAKLASLKVGWCGLGAMGYFMARNLSAYRASAYPGASPMLVYNRTTAKAEQLQSLLGAEHVEVARTPSQLASECDVVLTSLANDAVVRAVYEEYARALKVRRHAVGTDNGEPK